MGIAKSTCLLSIFLWFIYFATSFGEQVVDDGRQSNATAAIPTTTNTTSWNSEYTQSYSDADRVNKNASDPSPFVTNSLDTKNSSLIDSTKSTTTGNNQEVQKDVGTTSSSSTDDNIYNLLLLFGMSIIVLFCIVLAYMAQSMNKINALIRQLTHAMSSINKMGDYNYNYDYNNTNNNNNNGDVNSAVMPLKIAHTAHNPVNSNSSLLDAYAIDVAENSHRNINTGIINMVNINTSTNQGHQVHRSSEGSPLFDEHDDMKADFQSASNNSNNFGVGTKSSSKVATKKSKKRGKNEPIGSGGSANNDHDENKATRIDMEVSINKIGNNAVTTNNKVNDNNNNISNDNDNDNNSHGSRGTTSSTTQVSGMFENNQTPNGKLELETPKDNIVGTSYME